MQQAFVALFTVLISGPLLLPSQALAQQKFVVKPVAEKKLKALPAGLWYWRIENFPTLAQAQAAIGPDRWNPDTVSYDVATSLAAEAAGKAWLFTLGPKGGATPGGSKVAEIGPVPKITASEYLLRINHTGGAPGVKTPVHSHPGSETFYVVTGRLSQKTPSGIGHVEVGQFMIGHGADLPMEVSSSGTTELNALVMFVVDATRPFSTPAKLVQAAPPALDAEAAKNLIADRMWQQQQAHGPGRVYWSWKSDGSVCLRTDEADTKCADSGRWTLENGRMCYELTWWGASMGRKSACFRIVDRGKNHFEALQDTGFTLFEFSVIK